MKSKEEACSNLSDIRTISHPKMQRGLIAKIMTFQKIGQLEINYEEIIRLQPDNLTSMFKTGHKLFWKYQLRYDTRWYNSERLIRIGRFPNHAATKFLDSLWIAILPLNSFFRSKSTKIINFRKLKECFVQSVFLSGSVKTILRVKRSFGVILAIFGHFCKTEKADIGSVWPPLLMFKN